MEEEPSAREFSYCRGLLHPKAAGLFFLKDFVVDLVVECGGEGVLWNFGERLTQFLINSQWRSPDGELCCQVESNIVPVRAFMDDMTITQ